MEKNSQSAAEISIDPRQYSRFCRTISWIQPRMTCFYSQFRLLGRISLCRGSNDLTSTFSLGSLLTIDATAFYN